MAQKLLVANFLIVVFSAKVLTQCQTGCTPVADGNASQETCPGQLCLNTTTVNGCTKTTASCAGIPPTYPDGTLSLNIPGNGVSQLDQSSIDFYCGANGWYIIMDGQNYNVENLAYCNIPENKPNCPAVPVCPGQTTTTTTTTTTTATPCCPPGGVWSSGTTTSSCKTPCGSCSTWTKTRKCLSEATGCPCTGDASRTENCNIQPCTFPSTPCCSPYKAMVNVSKIICGPQPPSPSDAIAAPSSCSQPATPPPACTPGGVWSPWTSGSCNDTCGLCGTLTRVRTCASQAQGCPCAGPSSETVSCPSKVCTFPRPTCCHGAEKASNGGFVCVAN